MAVSFRTSNHTSCLRDSIALEMGGTQGPFWNRALVTLWEQGLRFPFCDTLLRRGAHSTGHNELWFQRASVRLPGRQLHVTSDMLLTQLSTVLGS